jgi:hypothetical protein
MKQREVGGRLYRGLLGTIATLVDGLTVPESPMEKAIQKSRQDTSNPVRPVYRIAEAGL